MRVKELIEKLSALPQEAEVYLDPLYAPLEHDRAPFNKITVAKEGNARITDAELQLDGSEMAEYTRAVLLGCYTVAVQGKTT